MARATSGCLSTSDIWTSWTRGSRNPGDSSSDVSSAFRASGRLPCERRPSPIRKGPRASFGTAATRRRPVSMAFAGCFWARYALPSSRYGMAITTEVRIGIAAFFSTCLNRTARSLTPLAMMSSRIRCAVAPHFSCAAASPRIVASVAARSIATQHMIFEET